MRRMIDILADSVAQGAADQHVRKVMVAAGEARDADRAGDSISGNLHDAVIVIFVRDYRRQRPRFNAMTGWKRRSAIKEVAASLRRGRATTLSYLFQCSYHERTVE